MTVQTTRSRSLTPSGRTRAPRLGGEGEARHLDFVLVATLAVGAVMATAVVVTRALAAVG